MSLTISARDPSLHTIHLNSITVPVQLHFRPNSEPYLCGIRYFLAEKLVDLPNFLLHAYGYLFHWYYYCKGEEILHELGLVTLLSQLLPGVERQVKSVWEKKGEGDVVL
jgi:hypothetical protein